jgi:hypothetical protein
MTRLDKSMVRLIQLSDWWRRSWANRHCIMTGEEVAYQLRCIVRSTKKNRSRHVGTK